MKLFRIEIVGELPGTDSDLGAHAHVASVKPVAELVKTLTDMGLTNVAKHIRVIRPKVAAADPKLAVIPRTPEAA